MALVLQKSQTAINVNNVQFFTLNNQKQLDFFII